MNIAVIGLGKLGLPMAALYACKGHNVIGCDVNAELVKRISDGECPYYEPALSTYLKEVSPLGVTTDIIEPVSQAEMTFVIVPTPSKANNEFSNEYIELACMYIAQGLKKLCDSIHKYPVIVIVSTVTVGSMEEVIKPLLEKESGLKCGKDFGLCYNPEFVALGSVIANMLHPDAFLIGESDKKAGDKLVEFHKTIVENKPSFYRMSFYNAEVAKIMLNSFVVTKINLINSFADLCEKIPTGDIDIITKFLGDDKRIGHHFIKGGLRPGGPCFPRDNRAYVKVAEKYNAVSLLQFNTVKTSDVLDYVLVDKIEDMIGNMENTTISILGFTYKSSTDVIEESPLLAVVDELEFVGKVKLYDPAGNDNARELYKDDNFVEICDSCQDCIKDSDLVILGTTWECFDEIKPNDIKELMRTPQVLDCWRFFNRDKFKKAGIEYHAIGVNDGN